MLSEVSSVVFNCTGIDRFSASLCQKDLVILLIKLQDELRYATLLVFANKQDLPNAMSVSEITDKMGLHSLRQRRW